MNDGFVQSGISEAAGSITVLFNQELGAHLRSRNQRRQHSPRSALKYLVDIFCDPAGGHKRRQAARYFDVEGLRRPMASPARRASQSGPTKRYTGFRKNAG